jgi:hypothetical protein
MKWAFPKNSVLGAISKTAGAGKRLWLPTLLIAVLAVSAFAAIKPATSYADPDYGNNNLLLLGRYCHDIPEGQLTSQQPGGRCHESDNAALAGWEEILADSLGCSTSMFYKHDNIVDPKDTSVRVTRWYTDEGYYKDCWEKAQTEFKALTSDSSDCAITKDGSPNYKKCTGYEDDLHKALGCDSSMLQTADQNGHPDPKGDYWIIKPGAAFGGHGSSVSTADSCQGRLDAVGRIHITIIGKDGKPTTDPNPISSSKVSDSGGAGGGDGGGGDSVQLSCEATSNPLSWIICPVINDVLVPAIAATDSIITQQLVIPANNIFCSGDQNCEAYYTAWASFRNLSLGLLAAAGLIVVIAQAIGMEILDAYTIRKMLPRILIAAIGITLSWTLMNFAVTLSNNLGFGVRDLIVAPFHSLSSTINLNFTADGGAGGGAVNFFGGATAAVVAVPVWIAAGGLGVLLSYVATAGLAVLVAILVLVLRQIAIIMLILVSPVALIAYVLPNTQRAFRMWWESFVRALLMFPLIAAFIAAGRVFAAISLSHAGGSASDFFSEIIGFVAYFGPYFMIPLTFSMSGAMMSGFGNMINSRASGIQGALSNYRKGQAQSRFQRARTEGLYRNNFGKYRLRPGGKQRSVGHGLNTLGFWGLNADEMIPMKLGTTKAGRLIDNKEGIPGFRRGGHALEAQIKRAKRDQTAKAVQDLDIGYKSGRLMAGQFQYFYNGLDDKHQAELDNKFALRDGNGEIIRGKRGVPVGWRAPDNWGERNDVANIIGSANNTEAQEAANELRATASEFEKYTSSPETNRVDGRLLGLLSSAKSGRLELEDVAANHNQLLAAGDQESAVRETTMLQDALTGKRVSAARGHGLAWRSQAEANSALGKKNKWKAGEAYSVYENPLSSKAASSLMRINSQEIAGSKSEDLDALRETMVAHGSRYEMEMGEDGKVRRKKVDGKDVLKKGDALERADQLQARLKTLAQYNYGDSDVGVKVKDIWTRMGRDPKDLVWGGGGSTDERTARDMAEAGHQEEPQQPDQGQG